MYKDVGVHFRGASSFIDGARRAASARSTSSLDFAHEKQAVGGYRTLNLLNAHGDPTFLRTVLYLQAAREYLPAPKANYVRVVINGESWGIYINAQQFNKDFMQRVVQDHRRRALEGARAARTAAAAWSTSAMTWRRTSASTRSSRRTTPKSWAALTTLSKTLNTDAAGAARSRRWRRCSTSTAC